MPRTIWKGALSFGLVNIPVGLYPATSDKTVHFNQFEEGTSDRIRYKKVNERTGKEVEDASSRGRPRWRRVRHPQRRGARAAEPRSRGRSRSRISSSWTDIDPVYFRATYYLAPQGEAADKAYALLRQAMAEAGKVAIATMVMRNKEYLVAIRPDDDVLAMKTMYFPDEVRQPGRSSPS